MSFHSLDRLQYTVSQQILALKNNLIIIDSKILDHFPVNPFINDIKSYPQIRHFSNIKFKLENICQSIISQYGSNTLTLYNKLILSLLIKDSLEKVHRWNLPSSVRDLYDDWCAGILKGFSTKPDAYYNHNNTAFLDDLSICCLRAYPIGGAWKVEVSRGRKAHFYMGGPRLVARYVGFSLFRMGGFKKYYTIHTLHRFRGGFNPLERSKCYLRIASLLKRYPNIAGMYVSGWLYDPKLAEISPGLRYLREEPEENGAILFRIGATEWAVTYATRWSAKRKQLYMRGEYIPCEYALIWPKNKLLEWASQQKINDRIDE